MTDYAPRSSQDYNACYTTNPQLAMSHYAEANGCHYLYQNSQVQYSTVHATNRPCQATYLSSQILPSPPIYIPATTAMVMPYTYSRSNLSTLPSQTTVLNSNVSYNSTLSSPRHLHHNQRSLLGIDIATMAETESQDSFNAGTMLSEPLDQPLEGYPNVNDFDELMRR